jgi:hypothetical protein
MKNDENDHCHSDDGHDNDNKNEKLMIDMMMVRMISSS